MRGRGGLGVVEVAAHHGLAPHDHLARLIHRGVGTGGVDRADVEPGPRHTDRGGDVLEVVVGATAGDGAGLGEPVAGEDAFERKLLAHAANELDRDVGRTGDREPQ